MTLEDSIHIQRLRVLRDAERLGNVSEACRRHGMSRTVFYRLRARLEQYGSDGVHPKRRQARRGVADGTDPATRRPPCRSRSARRPVVAGHVPGVFAAGCERLRIRVTRTKPRHAWTNGFVERFQKTILHEHWRIAFRRQYFTSRRSLQGSLDRFLQFYNCERTHRGYRLRGRTPVTVFRGAVAA